MRLRRGNLGVVMEKAESLVSAFIGNCARCNIDRMKHFFTEMGPNYVGLSVSALPMAQVSVDLLGPLEVKCFPGSRKTRKVYPLLFFDLNYNAIGFQILEGASGFDVGMGLLSHQARYSPLTLVMSDHGAAFHESVINFRTVDGLKVFDNAIFHALPVDSQAGNAVERHVQEIKKMLRKTFGVKRDGKFPILTISQLIYAYERICQEYNSVPYLVEGVDLCPMDFLRPYNRLPAIHDVMRRSKSVDAFNQFNCLLRMTREIRWQIVTASGKFEKRWHNKKSGHPTLGEVEVGDICMVNSDAKANYSRYCGVEEILGPTTVLVRLGGRSAKYSKYNFGTCLTSSEDRSSVHWFFSIMCYVVFVSASVYERAEGLGWN